MDKYKDLVELARRDENLIARISRGKEIIEFDLRSDNLMKMDMFTSCIDFVINRAISEGSNILIVRKSLVRHIGQ